MGANLSFNKYLKNYLDEQFLVFSNYTTTLDAVERMCQRNGITFRRIDGRVTSLRKRMKMIDGHKN